MDIRMECVRHVGANADITFSKFSTFPSGERFIRVDTTPILEACNEGDLSSVEVVARIHSGADVLALCMTLDCIRNAIDESACLFPIPIDVTIPFWYGGRQDRIAVGGDNATSQLLGSVLKCTPNVNLFTYDRHSAACPAQNMNRFHEELSAFDFYVAPDEGAQGRSTAYAREFGGDTLTFVKNRDPQTGEILSIIPAGPLDAVKDKTCVLVDDICDGGGTFIPIATALNAAGAAEVCLYVTHGIFSKGINTLLGHFDRIYTTDTYAAKSRYGSRVHVIEMVGDLPAYV